MSDVAVAGPSAPRGSRLVPAFFVLAAVVAATPLLSPPIALTLGMVLALLGVTAFPGTRARIARGLIQGCVIALGLRMDLRQLVSAAAEGLLFAAGTIIGAFALGMLLGRILRTGRELSILLCSGTAICGGSAIAAVGTAIAATSSHMAVATGSIFLLNAAALYAFPPLGHMLGLGDAQFGTWAGIGIHDVSSVVGAASGYHAGDPGGSLALDIANVVKLSRVLWIAPIAWGAARWLRRSPVGGGHQTPPRRGSAFPWFVLGFVAAAAVRSLAPATLGVPEATVAGASAVVKDVAQLGFQVALFLIGADLTPSAIRAVGWRALVQALVLWLALAGASLAVVRGM